MRIQEVTQRYPPALGGVEIHVEAIARALAARGHEVAIVTTDLERDRPFSRFARPPPPSPSVRRHRAVRLLPAPHGLGIAAPGMLLDLLGPPADVVHAHAFGMAPTWFASLARRLRSTPLILEPHADAGRGTSGSRAYARAVARLTLRPADRIVAQTRSETALLAGLGVAAERIVRIPDGIDLTEFEGIGGPRRSGSGGLTVLFVGRLYPEQKGLEPLVRSWALLPSELDLNLRIVGDDWGGRRLVETRARELGVSDRITLTGPLPRSDLLQEFSRADLFVLPSLFEPYGIVLTEAMAAGLPIVASRVGGVPEVVAEGENALLVPPGDPAALAAAMEELARDDRRRTAFSRAGRTRVESFSWTRVIPQWERLFEEVAGGGR